MFSVCSLPRAKLGEATKEMLSIGLSSVLTRCSEYRRYIAILVAASLKHGCSECTVALNQIRRRLKETNICTPGLMRHGEITLEPETLISSDDDWDPQVVAWRPLTTTDMPVEIFYSTVAPVDGCGKIEAFRHPLAALGSGADRFAETNLYVWCTVDGEAVKATTRVFGVDVAVYQIDVAVGVNLLATVGNCALEMPFNLDLL